MRDYLGSVSVNNDIMETLKRADATEQGDFWWLNNGVTILATDARVVAKDLLVENAQIVNGLQTTETLYRYFSSKPGFSDSRAILVKVIVAADDEIRARIIKSTNYQNAIELSYLRGLDKIQTDIEQYLLDHNWFYDRRKNYYKNQGKPNERIISIPYLASAVRAVALGDPAKSQRQRSRALRDNEIYEAVFDQNWDLQVYLVSLEIVRAVEHAMQAKRNVWDTPPIALAHFISFVYVCEKIRMFPYRPDDVVQLKGVVPSEGDVVRIRSELAKASRNNSEMGQRFRGVLLSRRFIEDYVTGLLNPPAN